LLGPHGVVRSDDLIGRVDRHTVARWVAAGRLLRPHPGVLAIPDQFDSWHTRALAGVLATGGCLSHVSALAQWRHWAREGEIHVSIAAGRRALKSRGLVVHRAREVDVDVLGGLPTTSLPRAVVDTWAWAFGSRGRPWEKERARGVVITALRERQVRLSELRAEVAARAALPGRRVLEELLGLIEQGCESELEIWGVRNVLDGPGMPRFVQQHPVRVGLRTVKLDAAVPELKVAIEMDGAAYHGDPAARERDIRRDAALAAQGWVVLRFSYRRLTREPEACRREILAVGRARRAQLLGK
jgi:very-short-patch-repair endonuclease